MAFKLAIGDTIEFPVKLALNDAGKQRNFTFRLQARRLGADEIQQLQRDAGADVPVADFLRDRITGWREQTLVCDEQDHPVPFSADAFDALLGIFGVAGAVFAAYLEAQATSAGLGGRAKNSGP
jgi:hypothetical protein